MIKYRDEGLSNGEIGKKLNIGMVTVWRYLQKLDNIREACIWPRDRERLTP